MKKLFSNKKFLVFASILGLGLLTLPGHSLAQSYTYSYNNPLTVNSFTEWLSNLLAHIQGIVGWLAVIFIVIGGVVYITSGGNPGQAKTAQTMIRYAIIGFAIAVAAPSLLKEIKTIASSGNTSAATDLIDDANPVKSILYNVLGFGLTAVGVLALIGIVIGGTLILTAYGDKSKADTGKNAIMYSIVALAVAGGGLVLIKQVLTLISASQ